MDTGGGGGGPGGVDGCVTVTVGFGGSAPGVGVRRDGAHPAATVNATRDARRRRTLVLLTLRRRAGRGRRLRDRGRLARGRRLGKAAQEVER